MKGRVFIGTSGWDYEQWEGVFYPVSLKKKARFAHYATHFDTVEINSTFYGLPSADCVKRWRENAPKDFIFSLKASRYITHVKKLKDAALPLRRFMRRARLLKDNLGPILFQLPPRWNADPSRLSQFIRALPGDSRFAFEFRDRTWFSSEVYGILRKSRVAFCVYDMPGLASPREVTTDFVYMRFHGKEVLYGGRYGKREIKRQALAIKDFLKQGLDVYVYFNNDESGYAVVNALELKEMVA